MGRRTETTEHLKERTANTLIRLMNDAPIEKIRIQEIAELAGVGRVTWFRYFRSKTDALVFKLQQLWKEWIGEHPCKCLIGDYGLHKYIVISAAVRHRLVSIGTVPSKYRVFHKASDWPRP